MECCDCRRQLDERTETVWTKVTGWERNRIGGGTNALALRRPLQIHMCDSCMRRRKRGIVPGQGTLL